MQLKPLSIGVERVIRVNLVGTYNVMRLTAARIAKLSAVEGSERGVIAAPRLRRHRT